MNPRDARRLRLKPQDRVDVVSRRGRVRGVELRVTETVAPGQVFVPFHYAEANANEATQSAFDPISREPNYKQSAVRVERSSTPHDQPPPPKNRRGSRVRSWALSRQNIAPTTDRTLGQPATAHRTDQRPQGGTDQRQGRNGGAE
jgi:predicted molibdopterin-dependent oxidoreductase YjgC